MKKRAPGCLGWGIILASYVGIISETSVRISIKQPVQSKVRGVFLVSQIQPSTFGGKNLLPLVFKGLSDLNEAPQNGLLNSSSQATEKVY